MPDPDVPPAHRRLLDWVAGLAMVVVGGLRRLTGRASGSGRAAPGRHRQPGRVAGSGRAVAGGRDRPGPVAGSGRAVAGGRGRPGGVVPGGSRLPGAGAVPGGSRLSGRAGSAGSAGAVPGGQRLLGRAGSAGAVPGGQRLAGRAARSGRGAPVGRRLLDWVGDLGWLANRGLRRLFARVAAFGRRVPGLAGLLGLVAGLALLVASGLRVLIARAAQLGRKVPGLPRFLGWLRNAATVAFGGFGRRSGARSSPQGRGGGAADGPVRRMPILLAMVALLVVGGLVDRAASSPGTNTTLAANTADSVSVVAPGDALSSSWFCAGATDVAKGKAPGWLEVTNAAADPISGTATIVASNRARRVVALRVPAHGHTTVPERVPGGSPWVGAMVSLQGGLASVEQETIGALGASSTPCATSGSRSWYFTSGATLVNASAELSLLNPFPTDAIVDLTFTTDQGVEQPGDFQGLIVPARGMLAVNLGSHLRRRQRIATTITARTGRLVAWKTDIVTSPAAHQITIGSPNAADSPDPAAPVGGVTVTLGAPSAGTDWTWPEGDTGNGFNEQYTIYNPGARTAAVTLTVGLDLGAAQPFNLNVAPESVATVVANTQARIPPGVGHTAEVRSSNGVPVVAERTLAVAKPSAYSGLGELPGFQASASAWLLGANDAPATTRGYLVVDNPGNMPVRVSVAAVRNGRATTIAKLPPFTVKVGRRASILLNKGVAPQTGLLVKGSAPIIVERDLYGAHGVSLSPAVPFRQGVVAPGS